MTAALPPHPPSDLRPYQRAAIDAVLAARRAGRRRLLVHLPTGAGKTVIFSHLARLARRQVLVLAHREELLDAGAGEAGPRARGRRRRRDRARRAPGVGRGEGARLLDPLAARGAAGARPAGSRHRAHHLRRVPPRGGRGQPARPAAAGRVRARLRRHAARLHGHHRARRRTGARRGVRGDRLHARPARADRRRLPGAAARLPDLDDGGSHAGCRPPASTSTKRSWPRRSTSRSATRWSRGRSRSWRATGARSPSA